MKARFTNNNLGEFLLDVSIFRCRYGWFREGE